jgi:hypothetical protein
MNKSTLSDGIVEWSFERGQLSTRRRQGISANLTIPSLLKGKEVRKYLPETAEELTLALMLQQGERIASLPRARYGVRGAIALAHPERLFFSGFEAALRA